MSNEGKIPIQSDLYPTNDNPRMSVTDIKYIKGAPQVFLDIAEMVAFHPNRMRSGMPATVMNWPEAGTITDFRLAVEPSTLLNASNDSIVTLSNFQSFWVVQSQTQRDSTRVWQYAPDGPGGGAPVFPYIEAEESNWSNVRDDSRGHKWARFRDDDVDVNADEIFDNWSVPIPVGGIFQTGDYIENRFKREAVSSTTHSGTGTMTANKYYLIQTGTIRINGNLSLNEIGYFGTATQIDLQVGRVFKFVAGNTYAFLTAATVLETLAAPPRTIGGVPNNEPVGWSDSIPAGANQLWQISGQKSVYGQLKTEWIIKKIVENPNYIRYSNSPSPHPDTIAGPNTPAGTGTSEDTALVAAGWAKVYDDQSFIATREDDPGANLYTNWLVQKINEESGEYTDRVFKLFDLNLDSDSPALVPPTDRDAAKDGWTDTPLEETATQINYVSEARKFFNGELKTPWSQPVPYTGKDTFIDYIDAFPADNFKYDVASVVVPEEITLTSGLIKGLEELSENPDVTIAYIWRRIYNNGAIENTLATNSTAADFYYLAATGSPAPGEFRNGQRLVIKPEAVTGQALFQCTQTISMVDGEDLVFVDEISIIDVSDGIDAKAFSVGTSSQFFVKKGTVVTPTSIALRAYESNIGSLTGNVTWQIRNLTNTAWITLTASGNEIIQVTRNVDGTVDVGSELNIFASTNERKFKAIHNTENTFTDEISIIQLLVADGAPGTNGAPGDRYATTSTTSNSMPTAEATPASLTFTVETGLAYTAGQNVKFLYDSGTFATAKVVSYNKVNGQLVLNTFTDINEDGAGGPYTSWIINLNGAAGSPGDPGDDGDDGADGEDAYSPPILSNESHIIVLNTNTGLPFAGEIGAAGKAVTRVEMYKGFTKLDPVSQFTIAVSNSTRYGIADGGEYYSVYVKDGEWAAFLASDVCDITVTIVATGVQIIRRFSLQTTKDAPGAITLDVDSDKGFIFTSTDKTQKTLTAKLYDSSLTGAQLITLPVAEYTFRWFVAGVWSTLSTTPTKIITLANILVSSNVIVECYRSAVLFRSRTITIADLNDGKIYRAYTDFATQPSGSQDLSNQNPTIPSGNFGADGNSGVTVSGVTWYLATATYWATHTPTFAQDTEYISGAYTWRAVYQIKGEKGDQGPNGNFFHPMYRSLVPTDNEDPNDPAYTTAPAYGAGGSSSTLAQMLTAGWVSVLPTTGVIWKTERFWVGQAVVFNGAGDPSTAPVIGSIWSPRTRISGKDGQSGEDGESIAGPPGPGYNGVTFAGVDGSGARVYNLNPVNGAAAAQIAAPKGDPGPLPTGGTIRRQNPLFSIWSSDLRLVGNTTYSDWTGIQYLAISFTMPAQSGWKPLLKFQTYVDVVTSIYNASFRIDAYIQRRPSGGEWSDIASIGGLTNASHPSGQQNPTLFVAEHIDTTADVNVTYQYRLRVRVANDVYAGSNIPNTPYFSLRCSSMVYLIPG